MARSASRIAGRVSIGYEALSTDANCKHKSRSWHRRGTVSSTIRSRNQSCLIDRYCRRLRQFERPQCLSHPYQIPDNIMSSLEPVERFWLSDMRLCNARSMAQLQQVELIVSSCASRLHLATNFSGEAQCEQGFDSRR
jgi:hypothetical protein